MNLKDHFQEIVDAGLTLVQIAPSSAEEASAFAEEYELPFPITADPDGEAFTAYGLGEGTFIQLSGPKVAIRAAHAIATTGPGTTPRGNARMLPGTAIVDQNGKLRLHQAGKNASDHMTSKDLLRTATQIMTLDKASVSG